MSEWRMTDEQGCAIVAGTEEISGASYSHEVLTAKHVVETAVRLGIVVPAQDGEERLRAVLTRLLEWDHFDAAGDGPFWRREIIAALEARPREE